MELCNTPGKSLAACVMDTYGEASRHERHRAPSPVTDGVRDAPVHPPRVPPPLSPGTAVRRPTDHRWSNLEQESVRGHRPLLSMLPKSSHPTLGRCPIHPSMELVAKRHTVSEGS